MKHQKRAFRTFGIIGSVALALGLASCVMPYDEYGQGYTTTAYRPGHSITALPRGYRSEVVSGRTYYYHDGAYYQPGSQGYVVVNAPPGSRYAPSEGIRRQSGRSDPRLRDRYNPQYTSGQVIRRLPAGHRVVNHRGESYYQSGEQYYRRQGDGYMIVNRPF